MSLNRQSVRIHPANEIFANTVLPRFFRHKNVASLVRQLNVGPHISSPTVSSRESLALIS